MKKHNYISVIVLILLLVTVYQNSVWAETSLSQTTTIPDTTQAATAYFRPYTSPEILTTKPVFSKEQKDINFPEKLKTFLSNNLFDIIANTISILALYFSIRSYQKNTQLTRKTIKLQKKQNRDSIKPFLAIHLDANEISITLKNHGLGPAILKSMVWKDIALQIEDKTLIGLLERKIKIPCEVDYVYTKPFENNQEDPDILAPDEKIVFIKVTDINRIKPTQYSIMRSMENIVMELTYTDIYQKKEWKLKKDMSWFSRQSMKQIQLKKH